MSSLCTCRRILSWDSCRRVHIEQARLPCFETLVQHWATPAQLHCMQRVCAPARRAQTCFFASEIRSQMPQEFSVCRLVDKLCAPSPLRTLVFGPAKRLQRSAGKVRPCLSVTCHPTCWHSTHVGNVFQSILFQEALKHTSLSQILQLTQSILAILHLPIFLV